MLDHISITVSEMAAAERFYDAIMKALDVVKVGRRDNWLGYGERARAAYPDRVYIAIYKGPKPEEGSSRHWCFKAKWRSQVDASFGPWALYLRAVVDCFCRIINCQEAQMMNGADVSGIIDAIYDSAIIPETSAPFIIWRLRGNQ